ncbi:MAG: hypothetical protein U1F25_01530 [Rubrivivax sp.]
MRVVECVRGSMRLRVEFSPRLDYGDIKPWIYRLANALRDRRRRRPGRRHRDFKAPTSTSISRRRPAALEILVVLELLRAAGVHAGGTGRPPSRRRWCWWSLEGARAEPARAHRAFGDRAEGAGLRGAMRRPRCRARPRRRAQLGLPLQLAARLGVHGAGAGELGCVAEADGFRRFIQRSAAGEQLRVLVAVDSNGG